MKAELLYYLWDGKVNAEGKRFGMYKITDTRYEIMWS